MSAIIMANCIESKIGSTLGKMTAKKTPAKTIAMTLIATPNKAYINDSLPVILSSFLGGGTVFSFACCFMRSLLKNQRRRNARKGALRPFTGKKTQATKRQTVSSSKSSGAYLIAGNSAAAISSAASSEMSPE